MSFLLLTSLLMSQWIMNKAKHKGTNSSIVKESDILIHTSIEIDKTNSYLYMLAGALKEY